MSLTASLANLTNLTSQIFSQTANGSSGVNATSSGTTSAFDGVLSIGIPFAIVLMILAVATKCCSGSDKAAYTLFKKTHGYGATGSINADPADTLNISIGR